MKKNYKNNTMYAFLDGDNVSNAIEILLIENKVSEAIELSENIKIAFSGIEELLKSKLEITIIILGGDDLLFKYNSNRYDINLIEEIRNTFKNKTGFSMSCGIGENQECHIICIRFRNWYLTKQALKQTEKDAV